MLEPELWVRLVTALGCGSAIGLERQLRGKPTGTRTCALICLGSSAFMLLATLGGATASDSDRVLGQLVTGVGFLGAGAMVGKGETVTGMTSAAVVWLLSAIGAAAGLGHHDIAITLTAACLFVLIAMDRLERGVAAFRRGHHAHRQPSTARPEAHEPEQPRS